MLPGFMNDIKPLWSLEHRRSWNEREWSWGGLERANRQKSCLSTCIALEQQALNRQGFPDIVRLLYTCTYTHAHTKIHMHAHAHPLRDRRGLVLSYLKVLWVSSPPHAVHLSVPLHCDRKKRRCRHSVLSPLVALIHVLHRAGCEWWMMMTPGSSNCN